MRTQRQDPFLCFRILTRGNEDNVDAEDGVREPSVEAVKAGHLQGGVEHTSGKKAKVRAHRGGRSVGAFKGGGGGGGVT